MYKINMEFAGQIDAYRKSEVELIQSQRFDSIESLIEYFDANMAGVFGSGWKIGIDEIKLTPKGHFILNENR